jgi:hypothetical protein
VNFVVCPYDDTQLRALRGPAVPVRPLPYASAAQPFQDTADARLAIYEALHDPIADQARREWLNLRDGELPPRVLQAVFPSLVIWASLWPDRPDDQIRFDIEDQRFT